MAQTTSLVFNGGVIPSPSPAPSGSGKAKLLKIGEITVTEQGVQVTKNVICDPDSATTVAPFMEVLTSARLAELVQANNILVLDDGTMQYLMSDASIAVEEGTSVCTAVNFLGLSKENRAKVLYPCTRLTDELTLQQVIEVGEPVETDFNHLLVDGEDSVPKYLEDAIIADEDGLLRVRVDENEDSTPEHPDKVLVIDDHLLREDIDNNAQRITNLEETIDELDMDSVPHAYLHSTLNKSAGDSSTTRTTVDIFACDGTPEGDCFEFEQTTTIDDTPYGYLWIEPGTYLINGSVTLQWVGSPRGTFVAKVGSVMGENFDFSQEQEILRNHTKIVTIPNRMKLSINITYDAGTPVMEFWIHSLQVVKLAGGMSQTNIVHDSTLVGQGSVSDPLGVDEAKVAKSTLSSVNAEKEIVIDSEESIEIEDSHGNVIATLNENGSDFKVLKQNGEEVQTKLSEIEEDVGDTSNEIAFESDENELVGYVGHNGFFAKSYYDLNGNPINSVDTIICPFKHDIFAVEASKTITTVKSLLSASQQKFSLGIMTDSHHQPERVQMSTKKLLDNFRNFAEVLRGVGINGCIHLGDFLSPNENYWYAPSILNREIRFMREKMSVVNKNFYMLVGNHDGINGSIPNTDDGYDILGDCTVTRGYGTDGKPKPYYYFTNSSAKVICLCLAIPYTDSEKNSAWSFDSEQLNFFSNALTNAGNDYHAIVFCHIHEYTREVTNDSKLQSFCKVLDAYNTRSSYSDSNISVDFSEKTGTKVVAWVCGHIHADAIYRKNDWVPRDGVNPNGSIVQNSHDYVIVTIGSTMYNYADEHVISCGGHDVCVVPKRRSDNELVELWDTMIYQRDLSKLCFIRFGSSATSYQVNSDGDRIINL